MLNPPTKVLLFLPLFFLSSQALLHSSSSFDLQFSEWRQLLRTYVKEGRVDYASLKKSPKLLNAYLHSIANVSKEEYDRWSRDQKIAFWLNAYNATAIKMVVDHYPLKKAFGFKALIFPENSIQQIPGVWDKKVLDVFGAKVSLNQIENEILRKEFQDPRIHFALVCASVGCPELREEPYVGDRLDAQFKDQIVRFLADPRKFRYDASSNTIYLSPIFKWFRKDFERGGGIISFLGDYLPQGEAKKISESTKIQWLSYDWSLNERRS